MVKQNGSEYYFPFKSMEGSANLDGNEYTGNGRTVERGAQIRGQNGRRVMDYSFRKIASFGVGIRIGGQANEVVGSYTGRKMRQKQNEDKMRLATTIFGAAYFGPLGMVYAGGTYGYQALNHQMSVMEQNVKADVARQKSLNSTTSMSHQGGGKI